MAETQTERERPNESPSPQGRNGTTPDRDKADGKDSESKETGDKVTAKEKKPKKPFKWTPFKIWGLVIIATVLIVLGTIYYIYASHHETTDDAYRRVPVASLHPSAASAWDRLVSACRRRPRRFLVLENKRVYPPASSPLPTRYCGTRPPIDAAGFSPPARPVPLNGFSPGQSVTAKAAETLPASSP